MSERPAQLLAVHERVLAGDRTASKDLFVIAHGALWRLLLKRFGGLGLVMDDAVDLATDAILIYLKDPAKFEPRKAGLLTYLSVIAGGDALNLMRTHATEQKNQQRLVELSASTGNTEGQEETLIAELDAAAVLDRFGHELTDGDTDVATLRLILIGEKSPRIYAEALGIVDQPEAQWQATVKQARDRVEKRLRRLGDKL